MPIGTVQWKYYKAIKALKISLGNLTASLLFAIAYVLNGTMRKKENVIKENTTTSTNEKNEIQDQETKREGETKKEEGIQESVKNMLQDNSMENERVENIIQMPEQAVEPTKVHNEYLLGISIIFLILSIIFFIIFEKRQQKRKIKMSK